MVKCSEICSESVQKAKIMNSFRTLSEQGLYAYGENHCSETVQKNVFMNMYEHICVHKCSEIVHKMFQNML